MRTFFLFIITLIALNATVIAQESGRVQEAAIDRTSMVLEGRVITDKRQPLSGVNIQGPYGRYATTDAQGRFKIPANLGDEIIIRRADFETVYYTIRSQDDVEIQVLEDDSQKAQLTQMSYKVLLDSAQVYIKKDAQKTADFLIAALSNNPKSLTAIQEAQVYEKLGDLYTYNQQADLAITNYKAAVKANNSVNRSIKLARAYQLNGNYQEAINTYNELTPNNGSSNKRKKNSLKPSQQIEIYTGLGDAYAKTNDYNTAIDNYNQGLTIAQSQNLTTQTQLLNTKIAAVYNTTGQVDKAETYYQTSQAVNTTLQINKQVSNNAEVADFYNSNSQYDKEIALRKQNLELLEEEAPAMEEVSVGAIETDLADDVEIHTPVATDNRLTIQQEQLKIAQAYQAQNNVTEAISYFESSLNQAGASNDLAVKKDAARNLSKLYKEQGDERKANEFNELYINTVDALYEQKEIELEETTRKTKDLINKQTRLLTLEKDRELTANKLALINTERELTEQVNKRQRWIIYSLVALSLLLISLAYFMWRNNKQQKINNRLLALKSLRSQMNPHFIFNALNSVNSYIAMNDERAANKYLADFSKLMRSVLDNSELDFIPLDKELELIELYLKLEHERFKDKFDYEFVVPQDLKSLNMQVPPMLLQPIIENAVWHGLRYKEEKGFLKVAFAKAQKGITITITDNGIGREKSKALKTAHQKKRKSKGLGNVENRVALLNELHNCDIDIAINDAGLSPDIGTEVVVTIVS